MCAEVRAERGVFLEEDDDEDEETRRPKTPRLLSSIGEKRTRARSEP